MKRVLPILGVLVLVFFVGRAVYESMASDETQIRWLVQGEAEAFNATDMSGCMDGFASGYEDLTANLDRTDLQRTLLYIFSSKRDPQTKEFLYRVTVPEEQVVVTLLEDDDGSAEVVFPVQLSENGAPVWEILVTAELTDADGAWQFASSTHETVVGARPGR